MGEVSKNGIVAKNLLSLGFIVVSLVYMLTVFATSYFNNQKMWSFKQNDWVFEDHNGERKFHWHFLVGMIVSALGNVAGTYFVAMTFQYSVDAGVNQGVMSTLFVLSAIFCAVFAYIFLNEIMGLADYLGMIFMIGCAILLSLSQVGADPIGINSQNRISTIWPVLAGIGSSLGFGVRSILM